MSMFGSYLSSVDIDCGQCINDMRIGGHHPPPSVTNDIFPPHYFDTCDLLLGCKSHSLLAQFPALKG